ncbi:MAG: hypothetical protein GY733_17340 [bacterium]|nr:hypothetical protein [bacterium]
MTVFRSTLACIVFSFVAVTSAPLAQELEVMLREAVDGYASALDIEDRDRRLEEFRRVERLFAAATEEGRASADLYANLGNAALQAEHLGNAVLAFRRALVLDPDHVRAGQNLDHVRGMAPDWVPRREGSVLFDSFFQWHRTVSPAERVRAAAIAFLVASLVFAFGVVVRSVAARNAAFLPGFVWCAMLGSMIFDPASIAEDDAVVMAREVIARSADSIHAPARFSKPLPPGTEVQILESRDTWLRVALANGRDGWVRTSSVERVLP